LDPASALESYRGTWAFTDLDIVNAVADLGDNAGCIKTKAGLRESAPRVRFLPRMSL
jgi:hypothetical protein